MWEPRSEHLLPSEEKDAANFYFGKVNTSGPLESVDVNFSIHLRDQVQISAFLQDNAFDSYYVKLAFSR